MALEYILLETVTGAIVLEDGTGGLVLDSAVLVLWEAGRIFDIDADNNSAANGALSVSTPSTVDGANYSATDVAGREGTLAANKINGHKAIYYGSQKGASIPALPTGLASFSVGLVANQDTGQEAAGTRIISTNNGGIITFTRNGYQFFTGANPIIAGENPSTISGGTPHAALAEISPAGAAFYVDGILKGSQTGTFAIPAQIFHGWSNGGFGEPAMAFITRTIAWNKVLSAEERAAWFADMKTAYATP